MTRQVKAQEPAVKMIRVKKDGFLYEYNKYLAENTGCEVLTGQQLLDALEAERNPPVPVEEDEDKDEGKGGKKAGLAVDNGAEEATKRKHALEADASKKLPK